MKEIEEFDPNVKRIEEEVVHFIMENLFIGQKDSSSLIKSYFITRKYLTQELLEELTGLSRGTISQEINHMLDMGIIKKHSTSSTGEIMYVLDSVEYTFLHAFLNSMEEIGTIFEGITRLEQEIEAEKGDLTDLKGFDNIYELIKAFSKTQPLLNRLLKELTQKMKRLRD